MSEEFSREAFLARLGPELMAHIEAHAAAAPAPSPEVVARVKRILAPVVNRRAKQREQAPDMADAA